MNYPISLSTTRLALPVSSLLFAALAMCQTSFCALFDDLPGLSPDAQSALIAHYDARTGVVTTGPSNFVAAWTPVGGNGQPLLSMVVTQAGTGPDIVTYDGEGMLTFSAADAESSRDLRGQLVAPAGSSYTVIWSGHHTTPVPFASAGNYVYNIGRELNHQRDYGGAGAIVELYDGNNTYGGADISAYDDRPTVWTTIYDDRSHRAYANGMDLEVDGTPDYDVAENPLIVIGAYDSSGYNFNGKLSQLIIFNTVIGDADRALLEEHVFTPRLDVVALGSQEVRLEWASLGTNFVLETTASLSSPDWEVVDEEPQVSGDKLVVTHTVAAPYRFYRLRR